MQILWRWCNSLRIDGKREPAFYYAITRSVKQESSA
jgi:hypothetical protein